MNKQEIRLEKNKKLIQENKNFLVFHGVVFRSKTGKNILIGGRSGSGKTYIYKILFSEGIVKELYDADLIRIDKQCTLSALSDEVFVGFKQGEYIYEKETRNTFGKLDLIVCVDNEVPAVKKVEFSHEVVSKYLIHESYLSDQEIIKNYENFEFQYNLECYIYGNNKKKVNISYLKQIIGKK